MKKSFFYLLVAVFILNDSITCLKTSQLCMRLDEYMIQGTSVKCIGDFGYECGQMCAVSKQACNDFYSLTNYMQAMRGASVQKRINALIKQIKACPVINFLHQASDVCTSSFECYAKKGLVHLAAKANTNFMRRSFCPCQAENKYKCGSKYCARDKHSCDNFTNTLNEISKNNSIILIVDTCGNFY